MSIEAHNLVKTFGAMRAVDGVSLSIGTGAIVGFLGPNGAGKSTVMRMLAGYIKPDSGRAALGGHDVVRQPSEARAVHGYLPESASGFQHLSALEFLTMAAECRGLWAQDKARAIERVVSELELAGVLDRRLGELSKGWRQRVWLGQALLHDPEVLLLDEPTDGLDPNQKSLMRDLVRKLSKSKAILLSTHILEEAEQMCDRFVILAAGRVRADEPREALLSDDGRLAPAYERITNSPEGFTQ